jgi:hypothetical protein
MLSLQKPVLKTDSRWNTQDRARIATPQRPQSTQVGADSFSPSNGIGLFPRGPVTINELAVSKAKM